MPPYPVGNASVASKVAELGMDVAISQLTLLRDRDDSNAWSEWLTSAGLPKQSRRDVLIVPDPNVRVQAVIDGQGIALMDDLVSADLEAQRLFRLSETELPDYGYFIVQPDGAVATEAVAAFSDWLTSSV